LIGPPTINAGVIELLVNWPVTTDLPVCWPTIVRRSPARQRRSRTPISHSAGEPLPFKNGVKYYFEVIGV
jgi:hypothetical protein